jgi:hypothetical protein
MGGHAKPSPAGKSKFFMPSGPNKFIGGNARVLFLSVIAYGFVTMGLMGDSHGHGHDDHAHAKSTTLRNISNLYRTLITGVFCTRTGYKSCTIIFHDMHLMVQKFTFTGWECIFLTIQ